MTIKEVFETGKKVFIPYICAGDPDLKSTKTFIKSLVESGADIIELGVPYTDPIADGPTNMAASHRALQNGVTLKQVIELVSQVREDGIKTPIILFTYLNPVLQMGFKNFAQALQENKVSGALVVDLPPEEAEEYLSEMKQRDLETVFLCSPTTSQDRLAAIEKASGTFVYYVSRTGVTGARTDVAQDLPTQLTQLKKSISKPIAIGFGISNGAIAKEVSQYGEAVVVGSALVKTIEKGQNLEEKTQGLSALAQEISQAIG